MDDLSAALARASAAEARASFAETRIAELEADKAVLSSTVSVLTNSFATATSAPEPAEANKDTPALVSGDLVWLQHGSFEAGGMIIGDSNQRCAEVQEASSATFGDGVFRICSRFSYRAKIEVSKIRKAIGQADDPAHTRGELNLDLAEKWARGEEEHNSDLLERLSMSLHSNSDNLLLPDDEEEPIKYGGVVQLQHVSSGLFVAMHKTPARLNPTCRRVSLKAGSFAAHFKLLPLFKVRSMGSSVFAGDSVMLQSVKQEGLFLGAPSPRNNVNMPMDTEADAASVTFHQNKDPLLSFAIPGLRPPMGLRPLAGLEVNGSIETRSLTLQLYGRPVAGTLSTGLHFFRLLHPETNAFMQASADPDKGELLDSQPGGEEVAYEAPRFLRTGGVSAHVPYLKLLPHGSDPSSQSHLSGKACWAFESLDRTECAPVRWYSMQIRLRHVSSGKFLSVDTSKQALTSGSREDDDILTFDTVLVDDNASNFTDPTTVFFVLPTDSDDALGDNVGSTSTSVRLEHRTIAGETLHLAILPEPKLPLKRHRTRDESTGNFDSCIGNITQHRLNGTRRIVFSTELSALDVFKIAPLAPDFVSRLRRLTSYIPALKRYSHAYHASALNSTCDKTGPISVLGLCDGLIGQCLDLIEDFRRGFGTGKSPPAQNELAGANLMATMKESSYMVPAALAQLFGGEHEPRVQKLAYEVKLLDALFNAILAPYNWRSESEWKSDGRTNRNPFDLPPMDGKPLFVHRLLHVAVQKALQGNIGAQTYFSLRNSRVWGKKSARSVSIKSRRFVLWRNFAIDKMSEAHGISTILASLIQSSENIVRIMVNDGLVDRFRRLIGVTGPDERLVGLFASMCSLKGRPSKENQERCIQKLWMKPRDRYSVGVSFHECSAAAMQTYGPILDLDGATVEAGTRIVAQDPKGASTSEPPEKEDAATPALFLGSEGDSAYAPVCVAWAGSDAWTVDCGRFWWSAGSLGLPVVEKRLIEPALEVGDPGDPTVTVDYVPIEHVLWVLEPERLCKTVTGAHWETPQRNETKKITYQDIERLKRRECFNRHRQLASYVVAQLRLLTEMCRGRSYTAIKLLEKSFSYKMLLNISTNPRIPYACRSASLALCTCLYVDRFPHMAIALPEKLWVYHDDEFEKAKRAKLAIGGKAASNVLYQDAILAAAALKSLDRHDQVPVVRPLSLETGIDAFPHFDLSPASSASTFTDNPVLSHSDHHKFLLLQQCCAKVMSGFGPVGRLVHNERDKTNAVASAAVSAQRTLVELGFSGSSYSQLHALAVASGRLLDGRSDLKEEGMVFNPPKERYKNLGDRSSPVVELKIELIAIFRSMTHVRNNYRLAQLLATFRAKEVSIDRQFSKKSDSQTLFSYEVPPAAILKSADVSSLDYIMQSSPGAEKMLYDDVEKLFSGGATGPKDDAAKLDLAHLANKPDFDQALIDAMMYESDNLFSAALHLLDSTYSQRRALLQAVTTVTLLPTPTLNVYGNVNALRTELSELVLLARTYTNWGVKSLLAGTFGNEQFRDIMLICDRLLTFLHTPADLADNSSNPVTAEDGGLNRRRSYARASKMAESENTWAALDPSDPRLYQGSYGATEKLWSHDVATTWGKRLWNGAGPQREMEVAKRRNSHHQDALRACDVHEMVMETVAMDPALAFKGSQQCTKKDKVESERRLTLVKRALLCVCVGFTAGNRANQALLFDAIPQLQAQACPPHLALGQQQGQKRGRQQNESSVSSSVSPPSDVEWPSTAHDLAQLSIITILRNNAPLCERAPKHLATLFALLAEQSPDPSTSPALELLFILSKPEDAALFEFQLHVCDLLLGVGKAGGGLLRLPTAVKNCVSAASAASSAIVKSAAPVNDSKVSRFANLVMEAKGSIIRPLKKSLAPTSSPPSSSQPETKPSEMVNTPPQKMKQRGPLGKTKALDSRVEDIADESFPILSSRVSPMRPRRTDPGAGCIGLDPGGSYDEKTLAAYSEDRRKKMAAVKEEGGQRPATPAASEDVVVGDPARLLVLLSFVLDGGNERCAGLLKRCAGVTIDGICAAILKAINPCFSAPSLAASETAPETPATTKPLNVFASSAKFSSPGRASARWKTLRNSAVFRQRLGQASEVLNSLVQEGGACKGLLALLVELVFVLPLNSDQVSSPHLWGFLEICAGPAFEALGKLDHLSNCEGVLCLDLADMLERLLATLVRLRKWDPVLTNSRRQDAVRRLSVGAASLLAKRNFSTETLLLVFRQECDELDADTLNRRQFVGLMERLLAERAGVFDGTRPLTPYERCDLEDEFKDADSDGNGHIDPNEFALLYCKYEASGRRGTDSFSAVSNTVLQSSGHRLNLRTAACLRRIVQMYEGQGADLGTMRPTRLDHHKSIKRVHRRGGKGHQDSAVAASTLAEEAAAESGPANVSNGGARLQERFDAYRRGLQDNAWVQNAITLRRFHMVSILEQGTPAPAHRGLFDQRDNVSGGGGGGHTGLLPAGGVGITRKPSLAYRRTPSLPSRNSFRKVAPLSPAANPSLSPTRNPVRGLARKSLGSSGGGGGSFSSGQRSPHPAAIVTESSSREGNLTDGGSKNTDTTVESSSIDRTLPPLRIPGTRGSMREMLRSGSRLLSSPSSPSSSFAPLSPPDTFECEFDLVEGDEAARLIQAFLRGRRERRRYAEQIRRTRGNRQPNPLCGAVALGWDDLVKRMVLFSEANFDREARSTSSSGGAGGSGGGGVGEVGDGGGGFGLVGLGADGDDKGIGGAAAAVNGLISSGGGLGAGFSPVGGRAFGGDGSDGSSGGTVELIFATWRAHLLKARTWTLDSDGNKVMTTCDHSDLTHCLAPTATVTASQAGGRLLEKDVFELTEFERLGYLAKQNKLNDMGVTALLATVVACLSGNQCRLTDSATSLFIELLNGGNASVQGTLLDHLERKDGEGRVLQYADEMLAQSLEGLEEARKAGNLGSNSEKRVAFAAADCEAARSTARFLQLLCEGHHAPFQNYLRERNGANTVSVNLVQRLTDLVVYLCDSSYCVSRFTKVELSLVSQLLDTLVEVTQGPCPGNQAALVMHSDVIVALNLILNAENARDEALAKEDPGHVDLRGKSCLLLAACMEGRSSGDSIHHELSRRLDTFTLELYKRRLEHTIHRFLALQYEESRLATEDEEQRVRVLLQCLVAVMAVLTELSDSRATHHTGKQVQTNSNNDSGEGSPEGEGGEEGTLPTVNETDAVTAALEEELRQATFAEEQAKRVEEDRATFEAQRLEKQDPRLAWFRREFPLLAAVGNFLNSPKLLPFWVLVLVLDCLFLLCWGYWRTRGRNADWDYQVLVGHFAVSVLFALDVLLRFGIHGLSRGRFVSFWSDRLNIMDASLVLLDVVLYTLDYAYSYDDAQGGSSAKALRTVRVVRAFRSARGLRSLRLLKFLRFARLGRHVKAFYLKILYELDSKAQKLDSNEPLVGFVEIAWRDKVERTCFPLPFEIKYLSAETKRAFLEKVDLSTAEKRMKALLKASETLIEEMVTIYEQAEMSRTFRVLHKRLYSVRAGIYIVVVLINLNQMLMPTKWGVIAPFNALQLTYLSTGMGEQEAGEMTLSLTMTSSLTILSLLGYAAVISNSAVTEVPMVIRAVDLGVVQGEIPEPWEVWWPTVVRTVASILVVAIHNLNFPANAVLYFFLVFAAMSSLGLSALRQHVTFFVLSKFNVKAEQSFSSAIDGGRGDTQKREGVRLLTQKSKRRATQTMGIFSLWLFGDRAVRLKVFSARAYAVTYDCLFTRELIRNHALAAVCVTLGFFVNTQFYTLVLLDVVTLMPILSDLFMSIIGQGKALGLIFYLFCTTVVIFTSFGMNNFKDDFVIADDDVDEEGGEGKLCGSMLACFFFLFYHGARGNIQANLAHPAPGQEYYVMRILFDTVFFVWVGLVLFNILTGLMVEFFSSARLKKQAREDQMDTECFVCGLTRPAYEDLTFGPGAASLNSFDVHMHDDHHIWSYVYYIRFLNEKDPTEDSGIESFVREQVSASSLEWIPSRTSFALEALGKTGAPAEGKA